MVAVASLISVAALLNAAAAFTCTKPGGAVGRFVDSLAVIGTNADAVIDSVRASQASAAEESLKVLSNEIEAVSTGFSALSQYSSLSSCERQHIVDALGDSAAALTDAIDSVAASHLTLRASDMLSSLQSVADSAYLLEEESYWSLECDDVQSLSTKFGRFDRTLSSAIQLFGGRAKSAAQIPPVCLVNEIEHQKNYKRAVSSYSNSTVSAAPSSASSNSTGASSAPVTTPVSSANSNAASSGAPVSTPVSSSNSSAVSSAPVSTPVLSSNSTAVSSAPSSAAPSSSCTALEPPSPVASAIAAISAIGVAANKATSFADTPSIVGAIEAAASSVANITPPIQGCAVGNFAQGIISVDEDLISFLQRAVAALRKRANTDAQDIENAYDQLVANLYNVLSCAEIASVEASIQQVYSALTAAGATGAAPSNTCAVSSSAATPVSTAVQTVTSGTSTVLTTTYVTTCPICTGMHTVPASTVSGTVYPASTITKATTITTTYCPEETTPTESTIYTTTYVTTCPICTGMHTIPESTVSGTVYPPTTLTKATTITTTYCPEETTKVAPVTTPAVTTQPGVETQPAVTTAPVVVGAASGRVPTLVGVAAALVGGIMLF